MSHLAEALEAPEPAVAPEPAATPKPAAVADAREVSAALARPIALVLQNAKLAHLGSFAAVLESRGYEIRYLPAEQIADAPDDAAVVIVLGGDMGVYEKVAFPHLVGEVAFLAHRLAAERPTLGVCLGAQLMAEALGASVTRGKTTEIGFRAIIPTEAGRDSPLRHIAGIPMMQWHGDTFGLPAGATRLASSAAYSNEAFRLGDYALAVQFHPELADSMYEEWMADGAAEMAEHGVDPADLRAQRDAHGAAMQTAAAAMLGEWLDGV
ncbi:MAG: glutamine amidotransferase [Microbacteriaceae bacterium]|nr:glutamine amidotransferase [Microbacteriaceae bacterium]